MLTQRQTLRLYHALISLEQRLVTSPFLLARGEVVGVTTKVIRARMNEVGAKLSAGINPYHREGTQVGGSRSTLPEHVRVKDEAAGLTTEVRVERAPQLRKKNSKAASKVFDGPVETVAFTPVAPGHFVCMFCQGEFPIRHRILGWVDANFSKKDGKVADPLELRLRKSARNVFVATDPPDIETEFTHWTDRALPSCRECSKNFRQVKFE
jgi:hypothetical protein